MAFLDNSGDIILDAVLTEKGRELMAKGDFKIAKYAFGDDEINYGMYKLNHPSGSAYDDLEVLQIPILEAFTMGSALKYGLISLRNLELLYLPNLLYNDGKWDTFSVTRKNNTIYVAVNAQTLSALNASPSTGFGPGYALGSGQTSAQMITIESCIDNADILMTRSNLENYIIANNLLDLNAKVTYDKNFINSIMSAPGSAKYATDAGGNPVASAPLLQTRTAVSPGDRLGFRSVNIPMARANIFNVSSGTDVTTLVQSQGVVGSMTSLNVTVDPALTTTMTQTADTRWTKFGSTGATITGISGKTFSTIVTSLEITGRASGISLDIPITLIKRDT
jgi:hypothetical protein